MQRLETRIAVLESTTKPKPRETLSAHVVKGFREILSPHGLEVPDALPGEVFSEWLARCSKEAVQAIFEHVQSLY